MGEYLDLYNENKELTNETVFRPKGGKAIIPKGKYYIVVMIFIENFKNEYLLQMTSIEKGSIWATTGGHVKSGQTSIEGILEEVKEELGIELDLNELELFKTYKNEFAFIDAYYLKKDIDIDSLTYQEDEVEYVKYLKKSEIRELIDKNLVRGSNVAILEDIFNK